MADREFFRWQHYHPAEAACECDCLARSAAFAAGVTHGKQLMLAASMQWAQLPPLLGSLLEELVDLRERRTIEARIIESDVREPEPAF